MRINVFMYYSETNFQSDPAKDIYFPIADMTLSKWATFTMGNYGEISYFFRIQLKFCFCVHKKRWRMPWKFQLEIRSNKKVIAQKRLANVYEMNRSLSRMREDILDIQTNLDISNLIGLFFYKFKLPEVQINLHFG